MVASRVDVHLEASSEFVMKLEYVKPLDKQFREWMRRYREELAGDPPSDAWLDRYLKAIFREQGKHRHIWWGVEEGKRVGFAVAVISPHWLDQKRLQGTIGEFYIYPGYRREGYGRKLAQEVIRFLQARGVQDIHCTVVVGNVGGLRFWEAMGFQLVRYQLSYLPSQAAKESTKAQEDARRR